MSSEKKQLPHCPIYFGNGPDGKPIPHNPLYFYPVEEQGENTMEKAEKQTEKSGRKPAPKQAIFFLANRVCEDGSMEQVRVADEELAKTIIFPPSMPVGVMERFTGVSAGNRQLTLEEAIIRAKAGEKVQKEDEVHLNFSLKPLFKKVHLGRFGKPEPEFDTIVAQITFCINNQEHKEVFEIHCAEIGNLVAFISQRFSYAVVEKPKAKAWLENDFRRKTFRLPEQYFFKNAGWNLINGQHMYLHQGAKFKGVNILTPLNLPVKEGMDKRFVVEIFKKSLSLYRDPSVAYSLVLFAFLGVTYRIFDEAGYPPHFLLFVYGKTGSFKTAISKVLYTQLGEEEYRNNPRRIDADTPTSLEIALTKNGVDTVTLLDDYAPPKTVGQRRMMTEKLEMIIRMVGDGSTKSRSNANLEDCRGEGLKGMVAITGEIRGNGLSSNLRCLFCEIQKERVNVEMLSWFQKNDRILTTMLSFFTSYLSASWKQQVLLVQKNFDVERENARKVVKTGRLVDTLVTLRLLTEILDGFFYNCCGYSLDGGAWKREARYGLESIVQKSENLSEEEEPARQFMGMLCTMISTEQIKIVEDKSKVLPFEADGFLDGFLYLLPERVYRKVDGEIRATRGCRLPDLEQLAKLLCIEGYIIPMANGNHKRTLFSRIDPGTGKKMRFFKISMETIRQISDEER